MTTIIIGAGITGLTAGLSVDDDVVILEKAEAMGGLCSSYHVTEGGRDYYIEHFYHHFFCRDTALVSLCDELGVPVEWLNGTSGISAGQQVYPLNTPAEILRYPHLTSLEKVRLALFMLKCKRADPRQFRAVRASDYVIEHAGEPVYRKFFLPLLKAKFGEDHEDISANWIIVRVKQRSKRNSKGEVLGYVPGGFERLVKAMAAKVVERGGRITTRCEVKDILLREGRVAGVLTDQGAIGCDRIICTAPALAAKYAPMPEHSFHGVLCSVYALKRQVTPVYWTNVADDLSFKAMIEHTNFAPYGRYGEHLLYLTSYSSAPVDVRKAIASYRGDLIKFGVAADDILWERARYEKYAAPIYFRSYTPVPYASDRIRGLYFAGIFSPPGLTGRTLNSAVVAGTEVAGIVNSDPGQRR